MNPYYKQLQSFIINNKIEQVKKLLDGTIIDIHFDNDFLIKQMCFYGHVDMLKYIIIYIDILFGVMSPCTTSIIVRKLNRIINI